MTVRPNFVGIGGQKCASTWLSECLRSHPEVFMSSPKELRFFSDNESKGFEWYLKFFEGSGSFKCRGEFSSNYIYWPESAQKIKDLLGDVKIIAVVRSPVERALSHIKHLIRDGDLVEMSGEITQDSLEEILDRYPEVISNSCYHRGLTKYTEVFGESSVFVVSQSACLENGKHVLREICAFLGVDEDKNISEADQVISAGVNPKFSWLENFRRKAFSFAKYRSPWLINWAKKSGFSMLYRKVNRGDELAFSPEAAEYLKCLCADDWRETQEFLTVR